MIFEPIIDSRRPYCGPKAVAILTGVPTSRAEFMIRRLRKGHRDRAGRKRPIVGVAPGEVTKVLKRLGCKVTRFKTTEPTLARFAADVQHAGTFLLLVTGHFLIVDAGMVADGSTEGRPVPVASFSKPTWRVNAAWRVQAPAVPRYTPADPLGPRRAAPKPKAPLRERRAAKVEADIARWNRKAKLAMTKLKSLRRKAAYYARLPKAAAPPLGKPVEASASTPG